MVNTNYQSKKPMDNKVQDYKQNPYAFVVGCPRSGTTLLQRMLDAHPRLAMANDTHFIPQAIESMSNESNPKLTSNLVDWVLNYHRFARLGLADEVVLEFAEKAQTYVEFVSALYSEYGRMRGKLLAGEKTPDYCRYLPTLHSLFPWVKSVHIIRDGRDVALSTLEWAHEKKGPGKYKLWSEEPVALCALWWRWQVSTGRRDGNDLGPGRYLEVTYEDLVVRPDQILRKVSNFLELSFAPEMLAFHVGKTRYRKGRSAKKAWLPPTPGLRDWRTQMAERDIELFEAITGDLISLLGYERGFSTISPKIAEVAEHCQMWWDSEMARRQAKAGISI